MTAAHAHLTFGNDQPKKYVIMHYGFNLFFCDADIFLYTHW